MLPALLPWRFAEQNVALKKPLHDIDSAPKKSAKIGAYLKNNKSMVSFYS